MLDLAHDPKHPLLFHTGTFLVLFTIFLVVHSALAGKNRLRLAWLLGFSLFYYWRSNGLFTLALVGLAGIDWLLAQWIHAEERPRPRKALLVLSIGSNLVALGFFKYTNFFLGTAASVRGLPFEPLDIFLPLGISFHVFQSLSYLIDVYRRRYLPQRSFFDYLLLLCFFPQIVAGPIVRAPELFSSIHPLRDPARDDVGSALVRILRGVIKKAIFADYLGLYADLVFGAPATFSGPEVLLGVYAYALQIYFDFSGYSDMALGMARLLGVDIPENFRSPYRATSITDFWRRWHISLSSWLREYLYVSLGGNRHGRLRQLSALMITMLLGGLWHGASWTFVVWGGLHGLALAWDKLRPRALSFRSQALGWFCTFHFVAATWVFFRATTFDGAFQVFRQLAVGWGEAPIAMLVQERGWLLLALSAGGLACAVPEGLAQRVEGRLRLMPAFAKSAAFAALALIVAHMAAVEVRPFIYFQF
jgi:alginate O-acetyltransferase complex protein AlgI